MCACLYIGTFNRGPKRRNLFAFMAFVRKYFLIYERITRLQRRQEVQIRTSVESTYAYVKLDMSMEIAKLLQILQNDCRIFLFEAMKYLWE